MRYLLWALLVSSFVVPKPYINPAASEKFGSGWTSETKLGLTNCARTAKRLPVNCQSGNFLSSFNGIINLRTRGYNCAWACVHHDSELKSFWRLEYGPWTLDSFSTPHLGLGDL